MTVTIVALSVLAVLLACMTYVQGLRRGRAVGQERAQNLIRQLEAKDAVIKGYRTAEVGKQTGPPKTGEFTLESLGYVRSGSFFNRTSPSGKIFQGPNGELLQAPSIAALAKTFVKLEEAQKEKTSTDSGAEVDVDRFRKL